MDWYNKTVCQTVCFPSPPNLLKQDNYAVRSFTRCCKTQGTEKQMEDLKQSNLQLWQKTVQSYRDTKEKTGAVQKVVCCGRVNINMVFQMWTYSIFIVTVSLSLIITWIFNFNWPLIQTTEVIGYMSDRFVQVSFFVDIVAVYLLWCNCVLSRFRCTAVVVLARCQSQVRCVEALGQDQKKPVWGGGSGHEAHDFFGIYQIPQWATEPFYTISQSSCCSMACWPPRSQDTQKRAQDVQPEVKAAGSIYPYPRPGRWAWAS